MQTVRCRVANPCTVRGGTQERRRRRRTTPPQAPGKRHVTAPAIPLFAPCEGHARAVASCLPSPSPLCTPHPCSRRPGPFPAPHLPSIRPTELTFALYHRVFDPLSNWFPTDSQHVSERRCFCQSVSPASPSCHLHLPHPPRCPHVPRVPPMTTASDRSPLPTSVPSCDATS